MWSVNELCDSLWLMLAQIRIRNQNNEASVEKLSDKKSQDHPAILRRKRVISDPLHEAHDRVPQDDVYADDNERNRDTEHKGPILIFSHVEANWLLKDDVSVFFHGVLLTYRLLALFLGFAEALKRSRVQRKAVIFLNSCVDLIFFYSAHQPCIIPAFELLLKLTAVLMRVLSFHVK